MRDREETFNNLYPQQCTMKMSDRLITTVAANQQKTRTRFKYLELAYSLNILIE